MKGKNVTDLVEAEVANPFPSLTVAPAAGGALTEATIAREVADVQVRYMIAKRFPRDPRVAMDRVLNACSRPGIAEAAFYQYSKGGTDIEGPSIKLLETIAREWGNFDSGVDIFTSKPGESEVVAYAVDLETGRREQRRFTVRHWRDTKSGGYPLKDEREIYELCANMGARRKRACMEAVIPSDVMEMAERQCRTTLKASVEITPEYVESLVVAFAKFAVTRQHLEGYIQRRLDTLTPALAMRLKKIHTSLKDGMSEPGDWFDMAPAQADAVAGKAAAGVEGVKERVRATRAKKGEPPAGGTTAASSPQPAAPAANPPAPDTQPTGGAALDEARELLALDAARDQDAADLVLDRCRQAPFYDRMVKAYRERFGQ
ncbi:MAG TPA: hypothetical protein VMU47_11035 [Caldimonas sp.]|nr:hypothetical protein [Caldimonas sp.]